MKKNLFVILVSSLLTVMLLGCAATTPLAAPTAEVSLESESVPDIGLPNPVHEVDSYMTLLASVPGVILSNAPEGATDVIYSYIDGSPVISQIQFIYNDNDYTYRAAAASENAQVDIAGVYEQFNLKESLSTAGGTYILDSISGKDLGLATWYFPATKCQYALFTSTGCNINQSIKDVIDLVLPLSININGMPLVFVTPEPMPSVTPSSEIEGIIQSVAENDILVSLSSGSTLSFLLSYIGDPGVKVGDTVKISYSGDITDAPEALSITVLKSAPLAPTVHGTVVMHDAASVFVSTSTGEVFGFVCNKTTKYSGVSTTLKIGNTLTISYTGDINNSPVATVINTTAVTDKQEPKQDDDPSLENKTLKGYVTSLSSRKVTVHTSSGHHYTFVKDGTTELSGKYALDEGCQIRVTYDGYASKSPLAKKIQVLAPSDPTPPSPTTRTIHGIVTMQAGNGLTVQADNGKSYSFLLGAPEIEGSGGEGSYVQVTFTDSNGNYDVKKIVYENPIILASGPVMG
ncbi:MAG: hypothetical protein RRZ24_01485 [Clostridia bacterium]